VRGEILPGDGGQHRDPVLVALAAADDDLVGGEVHVLHPKPAALEHPESGAIEQVCHQLRGPVEPLEQCANFVSREYDGHVLGPLGTHDAIEPGKIDLEHIAVQEQEGAEGLILRRRRHAPFHGQPSQEAGDLGSPQLDWVTLAVEDDVPPDPRNVALFGSPAVVACAQPLPDAIEEPWLLGPLVGLTNGE
jgi:hypothetical protein